MGPRAPDPSGCPWLPLEIWPIPSAEEWARLGPALRGAESHEL